MLIINIPSRELYDEVRNEFYTTKSTHMVLEHSLVSISKWESKHHKPFLSSVEKTSAEVIDYIRNMTITQNVDPTVYDSLDKETLDMINDYIKNPSTATTITETGGSSRRVITSEVIYSWMFQLNIPIECQKWHLNRLLTLIRVCSIASQPAKKMSQSEIRRRQHELNKQRLEAFNTKG